MILLGKDFWVASGWQLLDKGKDGWLKITDDFLAAFFARPPYSKEPSRQPS